MRETCQPAKSGALKSYLPVGFPLQVRHFVERIRMEYREEFDRAHRASLKVVMREFRRLMEALLMTEIVRRDLPNVQTTERLALFSRAWETLVSAYHLFRLGDPRSASVLLRTCLEVACTAYAIGQDEDAFARYRTRRHDSTRSIGVAKRAVTEVGELYGALSELAIPELASSRGSSSQHEPS